MSSTEGGNVSASRALATLRAATYRLSIASPRQLPGTAAQLSTSLWTCKDLLSSTSRDTDSLQDAYATINRFRTTISSLLQSRTVEGRLAAALLVKPVIEAGGIEMLGRSSGWIKGLLDILKKPDPPATKNLAVITLTRIFILTWDHSNLVRELTTPNLPTFISTCLNNICARRSSLAECQTILEAFISLLKKHPTIFRTNETRLRSILDQIVGQTEIMDGEDAFFDTAIAELARRLLTTLHHCSPKQGAEEKWNEVFHNAISAAFHTCDLVCRSFSTAQTAMNGSFQAKNCSPAIAEPAFEGSDQLGLVGWQGIFAGSKRLISLMRLLRSQIQHSTACTMKIQLGQLMLLLARLSHLEARRAGHDGMRKADSQFTKEEYEAVNLALPDVHRVTLELEETLIGRFGSAVLGSTTQMLENLCATFSSQAHDWRLRKAVYQTLEKLLRLTGPSLSEHDLVDIIPILQESCIDLESPSHETGALAKSSMASQTAKAHSDLQRNTHQASLTYPTNIDPLRRAAAQMLVVAVSKINVAFIAPKLRTQIERTAILTAQEDLIFACVLRPPQRGTKEQTTLMPLMSRMYKDLAKMETLTRPRMPLIMSIERNDNYGSPEKSGDEDHEIAFEGISVPIYENRVNGITQGEKNAATPDPQLQRVHETAKLDGVSHDDPWGAFANAELEEVSHPPQEPNGKRSAISLGCSDSSSKRLRSQEIEEGVLTTDEMLQPDGDVSETPVPEHMDSGRQENSSNTNHPITQTASVAGPGVVAGTGSEDSDFEMPPLTMEPDTDSEEEDTV